MLRESLLQRTLPGFLNARPSKTLFSHLDFRGKKCTETDSASWTWSHRPEANRWIPVDSNRRPIDLEDPLESVHEVERVNIFWPMPKIFFFHCGCEWWESRVSAWRSTAPPGGAIDEISWKERMRGKNPWSVCVRQPTRTDCRTPQEALNQEPLIKEPQEETSETSSLQSINVSNCSVLLWKAVFQLRVIVRDHSQQGDVLTRTPSTLYKQQAQQISVVYILLFFLLHNCVTHKLAFATFLEEKPGIRKKRELGGAEGKQIRGVIKNWRLFRAIISQRGAELIPFSTLQSIKVQKEKREVLTGVAAFDLSPPLHWNSSTLTTTVNTGKHYKRRSKQCRRRKAVCNS